MARTQSTFGGVHRPVPRDGRAHTLRAAAERASYDNAPATAGAGCLLIAGVLGATLLGIIATTVQVIA